MIWSLNTKIKQVLFDDKYWDFSCMEPKAMKILAVFYAGWDFDNCYCQGSSVRPISIMPEYDNGNLILNDKCRELYKEIYGEV